MAKIVKVESLGDSGKVFLVTFSEKVPRLHKGAFSYGWLGKSWLIIAVDEIKAYSKAKKLLREWAYAQRKQKR